MDERTNKWMDSSQTLCLISVSDRDIRVTVTVQLFKTHTKDVFCFLLRWQLVCLCVEWSTAILTANVHRCLAHSRAALRLHLLRSRLQRPTHNVGQADIPHVRLWTQTERR